MLNPEICIANQGLSPSVVVFSNERGVYGRLVCNLVDRIYPIVRYLDGSEIGM